MKISGRIFLIAFIILFAAGTAVGQEEPAANEVGEAPAEKTVKSPFSYPFGVRAGYTNWRSWSQVHVGAHVYLGELWPNVELTPNVEIGFGDDVFIMTINGDVAYQFTEFVSHPWGLYGGGSLSFNLINPSDVPSFTDLGLSALAGTTYTFANDHKGMAEIRIGIMDSPHFKLTFGYTLF
ncbi:MAG: hypothetical protein ABFS42_05350 [Candidatus Krumholzibacteriota bacterium]